MKTAGAFLLSPAFCGGRRAQLLLNGKGTFDLALRIRSVGVPIGEVFAFLSGLYFRGKLAYAKRFATGFPSENFVITPDRGLMSVDQPIGISDLRAFATIPVDRNEPRYVAPLVASLRALLHRLDDSRQVVLLGSVATDKYSGVLYPTLADRLLFPCEFRGRGDMSRGALLLRAAASGNELSYEPVPEIPPRRARTKQTLSKPRAVAGN